MDRQISDRNILDDFCISFCRVVEKHCKYIIVSGFLAISSGRTRGTEDIDMIIERLDKNVFFDMHKDLERNGFICMQSNDPKEIFDYLKDNLCVRYTYKGKLLPEMELKFAKDMLDQYQIDTRKKIPLTGLDIWFSSANMNIAFKEELLKSDKDLEDAEHLRIVFSEEIDEDEINKIKMMIKRLRL